MFARLLLPVTACILLFPNFSAAGCLSDAQVSDMAQRMAQAQPAANIEGLSDADGACTRNKLTQLLASRHGKLVGYKAGLTNVAVQKRFNTDRPVWGKLYESMLLANGASVPAQYAARPVFESDLLVRVSSDRINQARTPEEVLAAIDQVIPFIELPDLVVEAPMKLNGAGVAAINVGARLGVMGEPIATPAGSAERQVMLDALRDMSVVVSDGSGAVLNTTKGSAILDHPLNAVVWLAQALAQEGLAMKPGELISLGSFSPLMPPKPGQQIRVTYEGLPGAKPVQVNFK
ncbi:MAG: fumarylacetoacetate hydrolase [Limnohabitans sp.]|nr:fumarylacetoacetate hydrolase [Limnohabitans sp.]